MTNKDKDLANENAPKKDIDELSGVETTGHEWDGLKELNNPLPRWWLWVLYVSIIWSVWYFVVYPAWPTLDGATKGTSGYTQYKELKSSQAEIEARKAAYMDKFEKSDFETIMNDEALYNFAQAGGASAFKDNCATCHGTGGQGLDGYPNLNDDDWLWGGSLSDIYYTINYGIRHDNIDSRTSLMPAFGKEGTLTRDEINQTVDYVLALADKHGADVTEMPGHVIYQQHCASCHGEEGKGERAFGAPNLTDAIWLYGKKRGDIYKTIFSSRNGVMPAWNTRLDPQTVRQLAIYVHQLGGGEEEE